MSRERKNLTGFLEKFYRPTEKAFCTGTKRTHLPHILPCDRLRRIAPVRPFASGVKQPARLRIDDKPAGHALFDGAYSLAYSSGRAGYHDAQRTGARSASGTSTGQSTRIAAPESATRLSVQRPGVCSRSSETDRYTSAQAATGVAEKGCISKAIQKQIAPSSLFMMILHFQPSSGKSCAIPRLRTPPAHFMSTISSGSFCCVSPVCSIPELVGRRIMLLLLSGRS